MSLIEYSVENYNNYYITYEIYNNTMVKFLYANSHFSQEPLSYATLEHVYSIKFTLPGKFDRLAYLKLLEDIDEYFKNELIGYNFFYLTPGQDGFVLFMECDELLDNVLLKLTTTSQILNKHTKEEYNRDVDNVNIHRTVIK